MENPPLEEAGWGKREGFGSTARDRGGKPVPPSDPPSGAAPRAGCRRPGGAGGACGTGAGDGRGSDRSGCSRLGVRDLAAPPPPFAVSGLLRRKAGRGGGERMEEGHGEEGREGGGRESEREREEPGERDEADPVEREEERLLQEGEPGRGEDIPSKGPGGERKDRDCSQASDLLKDVERGQRLCPGPGDKAALGAEREGSGAGPAGMVQLAR